MELNKFNSTKYKQIYAQKHYKTFKVELKIEEMERLNNLLKKKNLTKAQFLRDAINKLEKK